MINSPPGERKSGTVTLLGHKVSTDALLLAAASVLVILVLYRKQAGSGTVTPAAAGVPLFDQSGNGFALAPQPINTMLASAPPGSSAAPVPVAPNTPIDPRQWQLAGGGYTFTPSTPVSEGGNTYFGVTNQGAAAALEAAGQQLYWFSAPGSAVPIPPGAPPPGWGPTLYARASQGAIG